jgi:uncharacterized RDD family membrane protein YckC
MSKHSEVPIHPRAGFFRRFAAIIYDWLVAIAVGMVAAMVILAVLMILFQTQVLGNQGYAHFSELVEHSLMVKSVIQVWVMFWIVVFFAWFWKNGGQTIGMRAWRLRLFTLDDSVLTYPRVLLRMTFSFLGLGTVLVLLDVKNKLALQDRIARTQVLQLSKEANHHQSWKTL